MRLRINRNDAIRNGEKYKYPDQYRSILTNIDQHGNSMATIPWSLVLHGPALVRRVIATLNVASQKFNNFAIAGSDKGRH